MAGTFRKYRNVIGNYHEKYIQTISLGGNVLSEILSEAGTLKVILNGSLIQDNETEYYIVNAIDSYKFPLDDFIVEAKGILESNFFTNSHILFIQIGLTSKIEKLKSSWDQRIRDFFQQIMTGDDLDDILEAYSLDLDHNSSTSQDLLFRLYLNYLVEEDTMHYPRGFLISNDQLSIMVYYKSINPEFDPISNVRQVLNIWIDKENPTLKGKQVFTRPFILKKIAGRKIISTLPNPHNSNWNLLLEGGILFPICDSFEDDINKIDSNIIGRWSIGEVEDILLNPVYYLGRHYEPYDIFLEWQYVYLYTIASLRLDEVFDKEFLFQIYENEFLKFIEDNVCYFIETKEPLVNEFRGADILYRTVSKVKTYLVGKEETGVSKNVMMLMRSRYCYLPFIYELISKYCDNFKDKFITSNFNRTHWTMLFSKLDKKQNSYDKGKLLEEIASYFISCINGFDITGRRRRGNREEVDLYFCNISLDSTLWELGALTLVECKNHKNKSSVSDIRNLVPVMNAKGIKSAIVFSTAGFTRDAIREIEIQHYDGKLILTIDYNDLKMVDEGNSPYSMIVKKINEKIKTYEDEISLLY